MQTQGEITWHAGVDIVRTSTATGIDHVVAVVDRVPENKVLSYVVNVPGSRWHSLR